MAKTRGPGKTDPARWRPDTSAHPPRQCIRGDGRDAYALGYCAPCAAAELAHAGVIRRRARQLIDVIAGVDNGTHDLSYLDGRKTFVAALRDAAQALADTFTDDNQDEQQEPAA